MSNENINKSIDLFYKNMNIYILHRSNELDHEKGRPAILLKYRTKVSLVWIGTHKIDKKTKEKPLVIIINRLFSLYVLF
ncbi:hypothetical protein [Spiroplasma ixodetis]|uniref:Uncharacterized protein n=1 Tax=Spiroplasma ixodetis TaxID=2141 RepID=A0ABM8BUE8_9MOLU|nr:hypothetical protein [Spiroplasma ixodetis]BDT03488.1 hypothetical protein SHM_11340 [Spiroplasma ixodetis]